MDIHTMLPILLSGLVTYSILIGRALLVLIIGWWIVKLINKGVYRILMLRRIEITVVKFFTRLLNAILMAIVFIAALSKLGVETASLVAVLGALGLAVGLSLKGSISNLASGILLIVFRPFRVGDYVEISGMSGTVDEIQILFTRLITTGNQHVIVPNDRFTSNVLTNFSVESKRRNDLVFGIGYEDNIDHAKAVILEVVNANDKILQDPAPVIVVQALADSSVNILLRYWNLRVDHFAVQWSLQETIKKRFDQEGISIPFPQRDVHMINAPQGSDQ